MSSVRRFAGSDTSGDGDVDAFQQLYSETFSRVVSYCRRRCPASDADDVVAETYLVAWRRLDHVLAADSSLAWLYGVARRILSNQRRSAGRVGRLRLRLGSQRPDGIRTDPSEAVAGNAEVAAVFAALNDLPSRDQELIRLAALEELSYAEIAQVLGMRTGAVRSQLHRARSRLRETTNLLGNRDDARGPDTSTDKRAVDPSSGGENT